MIALIIFVSLFGIIFLTKALISKDPFELVLTIIYFCVCIYILTNPNESVEYKQQTEVIHEYNSNNSCSCNCTNSNL